MQINIKKIFKALLNNEKHANSLVNSCNFGFRYISPELNNNIKNVLELGSGSCLLLALLSKKYKGIAFEGVDPNIEGFSIFKNLKIKLIENYALTLHNSINSKKLDKKKYDLIFSIDVFEHLESIEKTILSIQTKMTKNSKLIVICPNYDFFYEPHFNIPIFINKQYTYAIFRKKIQADENNNSSSGLWRSLNFITARKLEEVTKKNNMQIKFNFKLSIDLIYRIYNDKAFKKRKFKTWFIANLLIKSSLINIMKFKPFLRFLPYIHAEITLA